MRCADPAQAAARRNVRVARTAAGCCFALAAALLPGCGRPLPAERVAEPPPRSAGNANGPAAGSATSANPDPSATPGSPTVSLPPPRPVRSWAELRQQAAERLVAAHPGTSFTGETPETLLAIPVLEVELDGDGGIRRIVVLRRPRQALDTTQLAIDALHRAAPFGDVRHLPRPWKFAETFLFDEQRRFKPRSLD